MGPFVGFQSVTLICQFLVSSSLLPLLLPLFYFFQSAELSLRVGCSLLS